MKKIAALFATVLLASITILTSCDNSITVDTKVKDVYEKKVEIKEDGSWGALTDLKVPEDWKTDETLKSKKMVVDFEMIKGGGYIAARFLNSSWGQLTENEDFNKMITDANGKEVKFATGDDGKPQIDASIKSPITITFPDDYDFSTLDINGYGYVHFNTVTYTGETK